MTRYAGAVLWLLIAVLAITAGVHLSYWMAEQGAPQQVWFWTEMLKALK